MKIEREALKKENDAASKDRLGRLDKSIAELEEKSQGADASAGRPRRASSATPRSSRRSSTSAAPSWSRRSAAATSRAPASWPTACIPELEKKLKALEGEEAKGGHGRGGRDARSHRPGRLALDRHARRPDAGRRARQAAAHGRGAGQARGRPARGGGGRVDRRAARARRPAGSQPADRLVHLPRAHRRRQDRADQGAGGVPVRRRDGAWCAST